MYAGQFGRKLGGWQESSTNFDISLIVENLGLKLRKSAGIMEGKCIDKTNNSKAVRSSEHILPANKATTPRFTDRIRRFDGHSLILAESGEFKLKVFLYALDWRYQSAVLTSCTSWCDFYS